MRGTRGGDGNSTRAVAAETADECEPEPRHTPDAARTWSDEADRGRLRAEEEQQQ